MQRNGNISLFSISVVNLTKEWQWLRVSRELLVNAISGIIIYVKKLLDFDWLRAVQFKCNTSAESATPVQITHPNSGY